MDAFFDWFVSFVTGMFVNGIYGALKAIVLGIASIFDFPTYFAGISSKNMNVWEIIFSIFSIILVYAIWAALFFILFLYIRKRIKLRKSNFDNEDILAELSDLHKDVMRLTREKEKILALKVGQTSITREQLEEIFNSSKEEVEREMATTGENGEGGSKNNNAVVNRFSRLINVDEKYKFYNPPAYDTTMSLQEICDDFRYFACSKMKLYYDVRTIRLLFAGLASTKLLLLQGISGTGKTSLPYALGKYLNNDSTIVSVQPSWRDRTELFGFYNEFTKKFTETEVLRRIYEANYNDDINVIVLDEMNIARVEYYFAEMLSLMEMPNPNEWTLEIVSSRMENDPQLLKDGKLFIPQNVWYIGTANNDDSTFAVSDKVYDRAFTINLDSKGLPFECPDIDSKQIPYSHVESLYKKAFAENPVSKEILDKIGQLDLYIIEHFRVAFGNRIMKQLNLFVPAYVACGGDELDAIDYLLATKVFRKFDSLNLSLIRDEIKGLIYYLDTLFGKDKMKECIAYLLRLEKTY